VDDSGEPGHAARARRRFRDEAALLLLTTGGPEDVLARVRDGDPLGLGRRLVRRAAQRALLVPPAVLFARGAAHCARRAQEYRGRPRPDLWLERRAEEVVRGFERLGDRLGGAGGGAGHRAGSGAAPGESPLAAAAARFNACPRRDREALWRLAFAGATLDELARDARTSLSEVARRARRALDALLAGQVTARRNSVRPASVRAAAPDPVPNGAPNPTPSAARAAASRERPAPNTPADGRACEEVPS